MSATTRRTSVYALDGHIVEAPWVAAPPLEKRRVAAPTGRFPAWLRAVDSIHRTIRSPLPVATDFAATAGAGYVAGVSLGFCLSLSALLIFALYVAGKYTDRSPLETQGVLWYVPHVIVPAGTTALVGVAAASRLGRLGWVEWASGHPLRFALASIVGLTLVRMITWSILAVARRRGHGLRRALVVGDRDRAREMSSKLADYPDAGLIPVAILATGNGHEWPTYKGFPSARQLATAIEEADVEHVVLAPQGNDEAILRCVNGADGLDVSFSMLPPLSELFLHPGLVAQVGGMPLIPLGKLALGRTQLPGKRLFDLLIGIPLLALLTPIMVLTAIVIKAVDGGPVLYRQRRVGQDGHPFYMLKFRSMVPGAERMVIDLRDRNVTNGLLFKVHEDPRITPIGRIIRRLSVDELPQLINVIRGDMSLVGPRPLAVEPEDFQPVDNKRHSVPPGITGYWQIAGGNGLSYEEMIKLDLAYIQNWSLALDVRLLLRTIPTLIHRRGPS